ncbi:MAG: Rpn family recombination-promoting nuclease/putative transposase [Bacteroidales bacterium]|nr:Rpn family recombination-promoting nuclease/putative transposase [Lachnoclostridium sp.]MCM1466261.1 Rpn family recombination-promoting nuclease/putative transposase [Bacteroidales bacterium]
MQLKTQKKATQETPGRENTVQKSPARRKTLQELTLKDNFLFAAVMSDPENCRQLLELALGLEIERVEIDTEKNIIYHPEYRGVRLDVYARDEHHTLFNVEMQIANQALEKRVRYYHSQMDMELLLSGTPYETLPDCYVLFICDFDPFGAGKYRYTLKHVFAEDESYCYSDGSHTVFLSTKGRNAGEVPVQLVNFLKYAAAGLNESTADFGDAFVAKLQQSVKAIKADREIGGRYMLFEELLQNEHKDGFAEGKTEGLAEGEAKGEAKGRLEMHKEMLSEVEQICEDFPEEIRLQILSALESKM